MIITSHKQDKQSKSLADNNISPPKAYVRSCNCSMLCIEKCKHLECYEYLEVRIKCLATCKGHITIHSVRLEPGTFLFKVELINIESLRSHTLYVRAWVNFFAHVEFCRFPWEIATHRRLVVRAMASFQNEIFICFFLKYRVHVHAWALGEGCRNVHKKYRCVFAKLLYCGLWEMKR